MIVYTYTYKSINKYSNTIIVGASSISQKKNKNVSIEPNVLPAYLIMADYMTHFVGYYIDNHNTAVITDVAGSGDPYLYFFGFGAPEGTVITLQCDNGNIGFTNSNYGIQKYHASSGSKDNNFYNITGESIGENPVGILIRTDAKSIPNGTYNITIKKGIQKMTYKLIMAR